MHLKFLNSQTLLGACLAILGSSLLSGAQIDPNLPVYEPHAFTVPKDAPYVKPDGSIFIVGAEEMIPALKNLNELFVRTHPGTRFTTLMPGSSVGVPAILFNEAAFAIIDRILLPEELIPFDYMYHRKPLGIRVGRGSYSKRGYTPSIAICVNKANPLEKLTTEQVARIFTVGGGTGDITAWGQVGLKGAWAQRAIQPIGMGRRTGEGVYMKVEKFGDFPFSDRYEEMKSGEIAGRLGEEASAIAMVDMSFLPPNGKVLAIADGKGGPFVAPTLENVAAGRYAYSSYTYFFMNQEPGKPFDPFVKEYLRMVLSKEGQEALTNEPNGFLPLNSKEVGEELAKLTP